MRDDTETSLAGRDQRGAERMMLMLRVAKIVGQRGELPCIIRDVSASGVRLRLFHPLESESHVALELANGDFYFIEKVWERDGEAGFRFSAEIDVSAFIAEASPHPRRQIRLRTGMAGTVYSRGVLAPVILRDLSQGGVRIECEAPFSFGRPMRINAPGLPEIEGRVRWCSHPEYGIAFEGVFRLDDFARMIAALPREADDAVPPLADAACQARFG